MEWSNLPLNVNPGSGQRADIKDMQRKHSTIKSDYTDKHAQQIRESKPRFAGKGKSQVTDSDLRIQISDILDALPFYVMLIDEHHNIVQANYAVLSKLGVDPQAIIGKYCPEVIHGLKEPWYACPLEEAVEKNQAVEREAFDKKSSRWICSAIYPVRRLIGGKRIFFHMVTDITALKQEMKQRELAEQKLSKLYRVEKETRHELEKQIQRRIEFTRALIHDLKTPLTPMLGASQMLLDRLEDETLLRIARNINRGAHNLNNSISNLVDLTKAEVGKLELKLKTTDLGLMLREATEFMTPEAERKGQKLTLVLPRSLPLISADEDRLRQVVLNLLDNAMKFTPAGGSITVQANILDGDFVVAVKDTGCGIAKKDQDNLFEPYQHLKKRGEPLSGLGLGLPMAKILVQLHQGTIRIDSRKGMGTTVSFSIPLTAKTKSRRSAPN